MLIGDPVKCVNVTGRSNNICKTMILRDQTKSCQTVEAWGEPSVRFGWDAVSFRFCLQNVKKKAIFARSFIALNPNCRQLALIFVKTFFLQYNFCVLSWQWCLVSDAWRTRTRWPLLNFLVSLSVMRIILGEYSFCKHIRAERRQVHCGCAPAVTNRVTPDARLQWTVFYNCLQTEWVLPA